MLIGESIGAQAVEALQTAHENQQPGVREHSKKKNYLYIWQKLPIIHIERET